MIIVTSLNDEMAQREKQQMLIILMQRRLDRRPSRLLWPFLVPCSICGDLPNRIEFGDWFVQARLMKGTANPQKWARCIIFITAPSNR
jgi:hypothetical protein